MLQPTNRLHPTAVHPAACLPVLCVQVTQHERCRVRVTVRKTPGAVKQQGHKVGGVDAMLAVSSLYSCIPAGWLAGECSCWKQNRSGGDRVSILQHAALLHHTCSLTFTLPPPSPYKQATLMALMVSHYPLRLDQNPYQAQDVAKRVAAGTGTGGAAAGGGKAAAPAEASAAATAADESPEEGGAEQEEQEE